MKKENLILWGFAAFIIGGLLFAISTYNDSSAQVNDTGLVSKTYETVITGSTSEGDVEFSLTPFKTKNGNLGLDIGIDTHSVDLDGFNLKSITTLKFNNQTLTPVSAPTLGGHHGAGDIVFDVDYDTLDNFKIMIIGIPAVENRVFEWD